ncbi:type II CAAX prenyl endopeptidase Rce1 family protein [Aurantiacibacter odishensis]|uniref:CPBP family glutamic-type intramembrane protease n=1 Tax=Aurantiacibacter odishensis TaxID=1155476 RepID=UPI000E74BA09|nr:CPBP family glutamic-type intramembrane protease [Aurantiacibacter odishensis]
MTNQTPAAPGASATPADRLKQAIGWPLFIAQFITVALAYFLGSLLPLLPALFETITTAMENPGAGTVEPDLGSATVAFTVVCSAVVGIFIAWLWLRREGRWAEAIRLEAPANWRSTLAWAALGLGVTLLIFALGAPVTEALGLEAPDPAFILDLVTESPAMLALWIVAVAWFAAGFGEEVLYRGFLMDRLERVAGLRGRPWAVLVIQALLFGLPHAYQGLGGMLVTATVGFWLGYIRNRCGGNLWAAIIAHAAVDTVSMSLAYADKLGWMTG